MQISYSMEIIRRLKENIACNPLSSKNLSESEFTGF